MTDAEREAFRAEIRAYLLENPEVIMEAVQVLEARQQQQQAAQEDVLVAQNLAAIENDSDSWNGGNLEGDLTLVEFLDYRCGFCRRAHGEVEELVRSDGNIRIVVKEFPVLGEESVLSSRFAIAVLQLAGADAYKQAHDALITLNSAINTRVIERLSQQIGVDPEAVKERMDSREVTEVIAKNRSLAQTLGINGTPTFVVGGQMVRGYAPLETMRSIVRDVRAARG
ncbi:MAG: DsbA family protein [Pseudomonadota bacterium]